ncbi:MAG: gamma carbonic anhydrase family protein [Chloroflexi bacterium]|nr:gamma carbonic anhydrase family protein [Chloroflexota bacterium]
MTRLTLARQHHIIFCNSQVSNMIGSLGGKVPTIAGSAFISQYASIIGDVRIGEYSAAFPGAVVRADLGVIRIGNYALIEDNVVVHSGPSGMDIGDEVTMGHGAVVNCRRIGNNVLIGMNATVLDDVEIGDHCIIAAASVVNQGMMIPDGSFVAGVPAEVVGKAADTSWQWKEWDPELRSWWLGILEQYKKDQL